jgi:dTDP-glucose 4,6-dehydratase
MEIPVYGEGKNVRDWLYVEDHAKGIMDVLLEGRVGETYNIGGDSERQNIQVVQTICKIMDELKPLENGRGYKELITFVKDRPGHDQRYAIDHGKITKEMGWKPRVSFEEGIRKTVEWYLANQDWLFKISEEKYDGKRLGLK